MSKYPKIEKGVPLPAWIIRSEREKYWREFLGGLLIGDSFTISDEGHVDELKAIRSASGKLGMVMENEMHLGVHRVWFVRYRDGWPKS